MPHIRDRQTNQSAREAKYRNWTETSGQETPDPDDPDPTAAYVDLIQKDPTICDTCFRVRYDITSVEWWRGTFGWSDYVTWDAHPDANTSIPATEASEGLRLACTDCGARTRTKLRPVPADRIDEYADNLSTALDYKDIRHDATVLVTEIQQRNTSDNQCRQDTHVFQPAVAAAIRAVQYGSASPRVATDGGHSD